MTVDVVSEELELAVLLVETGQSLVWQVAVLVKGPSQSLPPFFGGGLLQARDWVRTPMLPQLTEQLPVDQSEKPPSTGRQGYGVNAQYTFAHVLKKV